MTEWLDEFINWITGNEVEALEKIFFLFSSIIIPPAIIFITLRKRLANRLYLDTKFKADFKPLLRSYVPLRYTHFLPRDAAEGEFLFEEIDSDLPLEKTLLHKNLFGRYRWNTAHQSVLLLGHTGTGKSISLLRLYQQLYHPLRLGKISQQPHVVLIAMDKWEAPEGWKSERQLEELLADGGENSANCVLLFDGFDEYVERHQVSDPVDVLTSIYHFFRDFKATVVSSRVLAVLQEAIEQQQLKSEISTFFLLPFSEREILRYIRKRYSWGVFSGGKRSRIIRKLRANDSFLLQKVSRRPLLLRYLEDITSDQYQISAEAIRDIIDNEAFIPASALTRQLPYWSKAAFRKALNQEINQQSVKPMRDALVNYREAIVLKARKDDQLENYADIYELILKRFHLRAIEKAGLSAADAAEYVLLINPVLGRLSAELYLNHDVDFTNDHFQELYEASRQEQSDTELSQTTIHASAGTIFRPAAKDKLRFLHKSFQDYYLAFFLMQDRTGSGAFTILLDLEEGHDARRFAEGMVKRFPIRETSEPIEYEALASYGMQVEMIAGTIRRQQLWQEDQDLSINYLKDETWVHESGHRLGDSDDYLVSFTPKEGDILDTLTRVMWYAYVVYVSEEELREVIGQANALPLIQGRFDLKILSNGKHNITTREEDAGIRNDIYKNITSFLYFCRKNKEVLVREIMHINPSEVSSLIDTVDADQQHALWHAAAEYQQNDVLCSFMIDHYPGNKKDLLGKKNHEGVNAFMKLASSYYPIPDLLKKIIHLLGEDKVDFILESNLIGKRTLDYSSEKYYANFEVLFNQVKNINSIYSYQNLYGFTLINYLFNQKRAIDIIASLKLILKEYDGTPSTLFLSKDNSGRNPIWHALFAGTHDFTVELFQFVLGHCDNKKEELFSRSSNDREGILRLIAVKPYIKSDLLEVMLKALGNKVNEYIANENHLGATPISYTLYTSDLSKLHMFLDYWIGKKSDLLKRKNKNGFCLLELAVRQHTLIILEELLVHWDMTSEALLDIQDQAGNDLLMQTVSFIPGRRKPYSTDKEKVMEPIEDFFAKNRQQVQQDLEDATAIVHFLLERGFDHLRRNHLGECAADIAEKNYMPKVAQLIRDAG